MLLGLRESIAGDGRQGSIYRLQAEHLDIESDIDSGSEQNPVFFHSLLAYGWTAQTQPLPQPRATISCFVFSMARLIVAISVSSRGVLDSASLSLSSWAWSSPRNCWQGSLPTLPIIGPALRGVNLPSFRNAVSMNEQVQPIQNIPRVAGASSPTRKLSLRLAPISPWPEPWTVSPTRPDAPEASC